MLSNNSIISVFTKEPLVTKDGRTFGYKCGIAQSYTKKDADGNAVLDSNGKRIYVKDFTGTVKFLNDAAKFIETVEVSEQRPARIRVDNMGVKTAVFEKDENGITKKRYITDIVIFKASALNNNASSENKNQTEYTSDDDLPFA